MNTTQNRKSETHRVSAWRDSQPGEGEVSAFSLSRFPLFTIALSAFLLALAPEAVRAQTTATYSSNCIAGPIACVTTATNLTGGQYYTNRIWQGRHLGIGMSFAGGAATNTGVIGFQFGVVINGANALKTTTKPFTITSTANGVNPVVDWSVLPNYTLGPADSIVLLGITNAPANVGVSAATSVTVSNIWIQTDTRP